MQRASELAQPTLRSDVVPDDSGEHSGLPSSPLPGESPAQVGPAGQGDIFPSTLPLPTGRCRNQSRRCRNQSCQPRWPRSTIFAPTCRPQRMHRHRPLAPGPTPTPPAPTPSRPDRTLRRPATVGGVRGGRIESRVAAGGHRRPAERSRAATRIGASPTRYCHSSTKSLAPDLMYPLEESFARFCGERAPFPGPAVATVANQQQCTPVVSLAAKLCVQRPRVVCRRRSWLRSRRKGLLGAPWKKPSPVQSA